MPTVIVEGRFRFVINTRENRFEPPHVHVWVDNQNVCRINLIDGDFMEPPPRGTQRDITEAYRKHSQAIREVWERCHRE